MPDWIPNFAVEIISAGNTRAEMDRKRREYFEAGVQLVWIVDPQARLVHVYTSADQFTTVTDDDELDGGKSCLDFGYLCANGSSEPPSSGLELVLSSVFIEATCHLPLVRPPLGYGCAVLEM